jgi:hypothetical protein
VCTGASRAAGQRALEAARLAEQVQFAFGIAVAQRALGRARLTDGDPAAAAIELGRARERFGAIDSRYEVARTCLDLATVASRLGDRASTSAYVAEAHDIFHGLRVPFWVHRTAQLAHELGVALVPRA